MDKILTEAEARQRAYEAVDYELEHRDLGTHHASAGLLYTSHEALRARDKRRMVLIREARSVLLDVERVRKRLDAEIAADNQDMIDGRKA